MRKAIITALCLCMGLTSCGKIAKNTEELYQHQAQVNEISKDHKKDEARKESDKTEETETQKKEYILKIPDEEINEYYHVNYS